MDETIENKYLLGFMMKLTIKAKKLTEGKRVMINGVSIDKSNPRLQGADDSISDVLLSLFLKMNDKIKHVINHEIGKTAENTKLTVLNDFIDRSRKKNEYFYLASSHSDCAKDHVKYQGRLYVDNNAPDYVINYAKSRGLYTLQWVLGSPAWFVTRPNCRHYFVSLSLAQVMGRTDKKLIKKYKTHSDIGNREFQTPKSIAIDEYKDRLRMLIGLYNVRPSKELKIKINKTRLLIEKWEDYVYNKK